MSLKTQRTSAEAHLYMDLTPCDCGTAEFARDSQLLRRGDTMVSRYEGACAGCGATRQFEFEVARPVAPRVGDSYGGPAPSQLVDAAQFLALSDLHAGRAPASPGRLDRAARDAGARELALAIAALDEVLKFLSPGERAVAPSSAFSPAGRQIYDRDPGRFDAARLHRLREVYAGRLHLLQGQS